MVNKKEKLEFINDRIEEFEKYKKRGTVRLAFPQTKSFEIEDFLQILYEYRKLI